MQEERFNWAFCCRTQRRSNRLEIWLRMGGKEGRGTAPVFSESFLSRSTVAITPFLISVIITSSRVVPCVITIVQDEYSQHEYSHADQLCGQRCWQTSPERRPAVRAAVLANFRERQRELIGDTLYLRCKAGLEIKNKKYGRIKSN